MKYCEVDHRQIFLNDDPFDFGFVLAENLDDIEVIEGYSVEKGWRPDFVAVVDFHSAVNK